MMQPTDEQRFRGPDGTGEAAFLLQRVGPGRFRLEVPFTYRDPHHETPFLIPADVDTFTTDLGSIPQWFTWLVPGTGDHLPAMLVHDAMVLAPGEDRTYGGDTVDRVEADRILRDAMQYLGTKRLRRWLVWTAVAFATAVTCRRPRAIWRWWPIAWAVLIVAIGVVMSIYMLTGASLGALPDDLSAWERASVGVAGAIVLPLPISWLAWRGEPESGRIGIIGGWAIAWVLWPTVLVLLAYVAYAVLEKFLSRDEHTPAAPPSAQRRPDLDPEVARAAACAGESPPPPS